MDSHPPIGNWVVLLHDSKGMHYSYVASRDEVCTCLLEAFEAFKVHAATDPGGRQGGSEGSDDGAFDGVSSLGSGEEGEEPEEGAAEVFLSPAPNNQSNEAPKGPTMIQYVVQDVLDYLDVTLQDLKVLEKVGETFVVHELEWAKTEVCRYLVHEAEESGSDDDG